MGVAKVKEDNMKKILIFVILAAMCQGAFLFAQGTFRSESEFYYFNVSIERILVYRLGYGVIYRTSSNQMARTFLPRDWFSTIGGRGTIAYLASGREWPSMTVFYRNGEFSHVLLRVRANRAHQTWGVIPLHTNLDEYFHGIEEVRLEY
jgi:hypothetical protein